MRPDNGTTTMIRQLLIAAILSAAFAPCAVLIFDAMNSPLPVRACMSTSHCKSQARVPATGFDMAEIRR